MDLTKYADTRFYAGKPATASPTELTWGDLEYAMSVRVEGDGIVATMTSGNCEWKTPIASDSFVGSVDAALEDACQLGRTANWSNDE